MSQVFITDVTLRDAHQCLIATRLRTEDMLPICPEMDAVGFWALEIWGGATFDSCLRFLKEDPWQRLKQLRQALPNTRLSMLLRGQNLLGYRHYADDVVKAFIDESSKEGIDVFRIFDALNDLRNLETSVRAVNDNSKHAQGTIAYTVSPVHTITQFVEMGKNLQAMGCDSIAVKDMAGLLTPNITEKLIGELLEKTSIPIHLHSHSTSGLASICLYKAVEQGCRHIDTAISAFSGGASHPCTESMVAAFKGTNFDTKLDGERLLKIGDYFKKIRKKYRQYESDATNIDPRVQIYQVPGGMISNLHNQLKEQNALDKLEEVHDEIPKVRKELGYPPLVTPTSQVVGTQAVLNVLTGERYKTITNEVKAYCLGKYGKSPADIDKKLLKKAIGNRDRIEGRPADTLANELNKIEQESKPLAKNTQDVLSYALFPEVAKRYFKEREANQLKPEPLIKTSEKNEAAPSEFNVLLHGESYHVKVTGIGIEETDLKPFYLTLDGVPEEVMIEAVSKKSIHNKASSHKILSSPGDVMVTMPSTIVDIKVNVGDKISKGTSVLVVEAMKMETEITAPISGIVKKIFCQKGDVVNPKEILMTIEAHG